jgi:hypothetical protein
VCACVGNQWSRGVVIARLRSSILYQSTYLYLSKDRELTSHQPWTRSTDFSIGRKFWKFDKSSQNCVEPLVLIEYFTAVLKRFVKILAGRSVFKKYLQIGPKPL